MLYQRLAARQISGIDTGTMQAIRDAIIKENTADVGIHYSKNGNISVDPPTEVRAGWIDTVRGSLVYVVMARLRADPTFVNEPSSQRRLSKTADALTSLLGETGYEAMR